MTNKEIVICSIIGGIIVGLFLIPIKRKLEKESKRQTEECMEKVVDMSKDIFTKPNFEEIL